MKLKRAISILLILLLCSGCGPSAEPTPTLPELAYTAESLSYKEACGQYDFRKDMERAETEAAVYYFEPSIDDSQRQACVMATDRLLGELGSLEEKVTIVIYAQNTYDSVNVLGHTLYETVRDWNSVDHAADVILAAYGQCSHYGLAYGYANLLCGRFGWGEPMQGTFAAPEAPETCDLNLLCFDPAFVSEADALAARQLACGFAASYVEASGEEAFQALLSASDTSAGMDTLCGALSEYYQSNGLAYAPSALRFGYGGTTVDYVLQSDLGTFYIGTDWVDMLYADDPIIHENFLHENYGEVREFFTINLQQMKAYQDLFGLDDYDNDLSLVFLRAPRLHTSYYDLNEHRLYVIAITSLMHEYIHALTRPGDMPLWETEGVARYFSYRYDHYGLPYLNQYYSTLEESETTKYIFEYQEALGRPIDVAIDFEALENLQVYAYGWDDPNSNYAAASSFIQFLVHQHGEENVIQHIYGDKRPLPKPYAELVADWNQHIEETYQGYSRVNAGK